MADDLDKLLEERANSDASVDSLLDERISADMAEPAPAKNLTPEQRDEELRKVREHFAQDKDFPWYQRAARGFVDPLVGAGQLIQNVVPDAVLNAGRKVSDPLLNAILPGEDKDTSNTTTAGFNSMLARDEAGYQAERENAGQSGIDVARIAGTVANPVTWLGGGSGSGLKAAISAGAKAGAFQALLQPVTSGSNFFLDKGIQTAVGAAFGGTLGAAFAGLKPAFTAVGEKLRKVFGSGADDAARNAAATQATDGIFRAANADPAKVDPIVFSAVRDELQDAAKIGVVPDPVVMTNRADAAALPVPVELSRGMASGDAFQRSWEINNAKIAGGEALAAVENNARRNLVLNLDELGAKNALPPFEASQQFIKRIKDVDDGLSKAIDEAYKGVRNSAGQPAALNHDQFVKKAFDGLRGGGLQEVLLREAPAVADVLNSLQLNRSPLTVEMAQAFDKAWTGMQKGGSESKNRAIEIVKKAMFDTDVSDTLGAASMQAYRQAKTLAKQRFDLIDATPAYKAIIEGSNRAEPEKFFQNYVAGANVSELEGLKKILGPDLVKTAQDTAVRGLKKAAIGTGSEERAAFSQANYNNAIHNEVMGPRLRKLFEEDPERLQHLYRVGRVAETVGKYPQGHSVNTSNTEITRANQAGEVVRDLASKAASTTRIGGLLELGREASERAAMKAKVAEAVRPGVTKQPIPAPSASPAVRRISDLLSRGGAAYGASEALTPQEQE